MAKKLDYVEGLLEWKLEPDSLLYDFEGLKERLDLMRELRTSKRNDDTLARCLRQDLVKNIFNTSDPRLYRECFHGTKKLIEDYHNEIILCIK